MSNWILLAVLGVVSIIAGVLALLNPFPASLAAVQLAAWAFLIIGAVQIFAAFSAKSWGGKLWTLLLGVVAVLVGVNLLGKPLAGLITLTLVLGVMFIVSDSLNSSLAGESIEPNLRPLFSFLVRRP